MNCPTEFRIFKGRKVSKLPSNSDVCYVLLSCNCTLYQKVNTCKKKGCKCDEFTWKQVCIKEPFVFIDVCKEMVTLVNIQSTPCQIKAPCKSSCGSPCGSCTSCTSCSSGTVTTTSSTTSELGSASSLTCPLDSDPLVTFCTITVDSSNTLRSTTTSATCPTGATTPTITITNLAEWSVCSGSDVDLTGSILGSATNFLIVTPPGSNATFSSLSGNPDQLTVQDVFDQTVNPDGIPVLLFDLVGGSFRAGVFSADDLDTIPFTILTPSGETIFSPTAAFGTNSRATQPNSFAMGWNAFAYLPGSMAHSSCNTVAPLRAGPPAQPTQCNTEPNEDVIGASQYIRFLMTGVTSCVPGSFFCDGCDCDADPPTCPDACLSSADKLCPELIRDIVCREVTPPTDPPTFEVVCSVRNSVPACVPDGLHRTAAEFCCSDDVDGNYVVTDFFLCDPSVDTDTDPTAACPYLPCLGTAYGEIEIVAPRGVGCNTARVLCPLGQKWSFVISQIRTDNEITHIVERIEEISGNNSLLGDTDNNRYTLCIFPTACDSSGLVRFCFRLIRNFPIGTTPGDNIAPPFAATVTMTFIAAGVCTPLDCGVEVTPRECFLCCPIPVDVTGDPDCLPRCTTGCTGTVDLTCGTSSSSSSSSHSMSSTARAARSRVVRNTTTKSSPQSKFAFAAPKTANSSQQTGAFSQPKVTARSAQSARSVQSSRSVQQVRTSQGSRTLARKPCTSCGGASSRARVTTQGRTTKGGTVVSSTPAHTSE